MFNMRNLIIGLAWIPMLIIWWFAVLLAQLNFGPSIDIGTFFGLPPTPPSIGDYVEFYLALGIGLIPLVVLACFTRSVPSLTISGLCVLLSSAIFTLLAYEGRASSSGSYTATLFNVPPVGVWVAAALLFRSRSRRAVKAASTASTSISQPPITEPSAAIRTSATPEYPWLVVPTVSHQSVQPTSPSATGVPSPSRTGPSVLPSLTSQSHGASITSDHATALCDAYPRESRLIKGLLVSSAGFLLLGIFWPLFTIRKQLVVFFGLVEIDLGHNTVSLASSLVEFLDTDEHFLFVVILLFSVVFPTFKLFVLYQFWFRPHSLHKLEKLNHLLAITGKWSMLDVFVVALGVVGVKLKDVVDVTLHWGGIYFALAVMLSMFANMRITRMLRVAVSQPRPLATPRMPIAPQPTALDKLPYARHLVAFVLGLLCAVIFLPGALRTMSTFPSPGVIFGVVQMTLGVVCGRGARYHWQRRALCIPLSRALAPRARDAQTASIDRCNGCSRPCPANSRFCPNCGLMLATERRES